MNDLPFELKFDPLTIKHLGVRMYSTLPPALAEIVSNSYDADANKVLIKLTQKGGKLNEIRVTGDGKGLSLEEINNKFLMIGRNRRNDEGAPLLSMGAYPLGKRGLVQIYFELIRNLTGLNTDGTALVNSLFGNKPFTNLPTVQLTI